MQNVDFGKTHDDYKMHRKGFPDEFFDCLSDDGLIKDSLRVLDLGTGTGTVARGFAKRGGVVTGLDKSEQMMGQAKALDAENGVTIAYVVGKAEEANLDARSFDLVTAGQCWHWFQRDKAAQEAHRLLTDDGRILICYFDWIPMPGNVVSMTEALIKEFNPDWKMGDGNGFYPWWLKDLYQNGFQDCRTQSFDQMVPYTQEAWMGRIRASAGVGATLSPEIVQEFDEEHKRRLTDMFGEDDLRVHHRIWWVTAGKAVLNE